MCVYVCSHRNDEEKVGGVCVLTGMIRRMGVCVLMGMIRSMCGGVCVCSHRNDENVCVCVLTGMMRMFGGVCVLTGMIRRRWVVCVCLRTKEAAGGVAQCALFPQQERE